MFVELILPLNHPNTLTYSVPVDLQNSIQIGIRVEVKLGKNKVYAAIVQDIHNNKPLGFQVNPIISVIDKVPILLEWQLKFWNWIAEYYMCSLGSIMQIALPAHLKLMNETFIIWLDAIDEIPDAFPEVLRTACFYLIDKKRVTLPQLKEYVPVELISTVIQDLINLDLVKISDALEEKYKPVLVDRVALHPDFHNKDAQKKLFDQLSNAPKQSAIVMVYLAQNPAFQSVEIPQLLEKSKASRASLNSLVEKEIFVLSQLEKDRIVLDNIPTFKDVALNESQEIANDAIDDAVQENKTILLHGVTGSGKTILYIKQIEKVLKSGKQVLFLLPEIALTTQMVQRLIAHFGNIVGVYHSRFSNNERVELWNKVKSGACQLIVGARSSLWLPFKDLSLIIVDEEHDSSLKQTDPAPRFHARDAALYLAHIQKIPVILGTATPSLESMFNAEKGKYVYVPLKERYLQTALPDIQVVPANHLQRSLSDFISYPLIQEIQNTLQNAKQVILFQNRRGYVPIVICGECQVVVQCQFCDVSLTYHKRTDKMHCHYCGYSEAFPKKCASCGSYKMGSKNFGTEKVEEDLQRIFPKHRTARLDWDSAKSKNKQLQIIESFERGSIDILVGTQMIVKGFDFPNVGLVGVLNADALWSFPNFRVYERAFQLLTQVSGRAGRMKEQGKVLIQAFNTKHGILEKVIQHDYFGFYQEEMHARKLFYYPPYFKLIKVLIKDRDEKKCLLAAQWLAHFLKESNKVTFQGPVASVVSRIRNNYIQEILIKSSAQLVYIQKTKEILRDAIEATKAKRGFSNIQIQVDVDPD